MRQKLEEGLASDLPTCQGTGQGGRGASLELAFDAHGQGVDDAYMEGFHQPVVMGWDVDRHVGEVMSRTAVEAGQCDGTSADGDRGFERSDDIRRLSAGADRDD